MKLKSCSKCGLEKDETEFHKNAQQASGLNPACKQCKAIYAKNYIEKIPDSNREYQAQWQRDNKDKRQATSAKWHAANPEKIKLGRMLRHELINQHRREWRAKKKANGIAIDAEWKSKNKDKIKAYKKKHETKYPHKSIEMNAKRRAAKKNAIPAWANRKYIKIFYLLAKLDSIETGIKMVVDHIVPLQSKFVCGLHCEDNLQILTETANSKKLNFYWPHMW